MPLFTSGGLGLGLVYITGVRGGGLIVCWLPFFTLAVVRPFCGARCLRAIHPAVVSLIANSFSFYSETLTFAVLEQTFRVTPLLFIVIYLRILMQ